MANANGENTVDSGGDSIIFKVFLLRRRLIFSMLHSDLFLARFLLSLAQILTFKQIYNSSEMEKIIKQKHIIK